MSPATFDPALFSEVQGIYVAALYRAMGTKGWTTVLDKESDWEEIAMAFKVWVDGRVKSCLEVV
jgi:hypothetical protein